MSTKGLQFVRGPKLADAPSERRQRCLMHTIDESYINV